MVHGKEFVDAMRLVEDDYRSKSTQLSLEEWLVRPRKQKIRDNLSRLTSSLQ